MLTLCVLKHLKTGLNNRKIHSTEMKLGSEGKQVTGNSMNQNIWNQSKVFASIF